MVTFSELFIYRSLNTEGLGFSCYCACLCIIFKYFETKNGLCAAKLVEYKYKNVFHSRGSLFHSYNLWRHILHTHIKSTLYVLHTDCPFLLFFLYLWIQRQQRIIIIKVNLFTFILYTALYSHACDLKCPLQQKVSITPIHRGKSFLTSPTLPTLRYMATQSYDHVWVVLRLSLELSQIISVAFGLSWPQINLNRSHSTYFIF